MIVQSIITLIRIMCSYYISWIYRSKSPLNHFLLQSKTNLIFLIFTRVKSICWWVEYVVGSKEYQKDFLSLHGFGIVQREFHQFFSNIGPKIHSHKPKSPFGHKIQKFVVGLFCLFLFRHRVVRLRWSIDATYVERVAASDDYNPAILKQ